MLTGVIWPQYNQLNKIFSFLYLFLNPYRVEFLTDLQCCHFLMPRVLMPSSFIFSSIDHAKCLALNFCCWIFRSMSLGKDVHTNLQLLPQEFNSDVSVLPVTLFQITKIVTLSLKYKGKVTKLLVQLQETLHNF